MTLHLGLLTIFALALLPLQAAAQSFTDLNSQHLNSEAIEYLRSEGVVQGYDDSTFKPENRINRAEMTKIIVEAVYSDEEITSCIEENIDTNNDTVFYPDVPRNEWYAPYVCVATVNNIVDGHEDGTYKPAVFTNFAEMSKIITNALEIEPSQESPGGKWFDGFVLALEERSAIPSTVHFFDKQVLRGEMSEMMWRLQTERTDKVSLTYYDISAELPNINSCKALLEKFQEYRYDYTYGPIEPAFLEETEFMDLATDEREATTGAPAPEAASADSAEDFSETLVQVEGVDEADIIKNDGEFIYMIKDNTIRILKAFPPQELEELTNHSFSEDAFSPSEMYLNGDQLVVIGATFDGYEQTEDLRLAPHFTGSRTRVYTFDISDRSNIVETRKVTFDGNYTTSRRIGDNLYTVINQYPHFWALEEIENGEDLLPRIQINDEEFETTANCEEISYFPGHSTPNYLIVSAIELDDPNSEVDTEVMLGSSENVFSSLNNLYVTTTEVNHKKVTDWDWRRDRIHSLVFKFNLEDGEINYENRGRVPGKPLNQFSMDEQENTFRIATTKEASWRIDEQSSNNVYILNDNMQRLGEVENIAPGERIFSTRFIGDRLYMVTFRNIDPFFVIDLSDPANPNILGELKIPGFSDFLQPFDENHIIGFGKETVEVDEDIAFVEGFKMALFDVTDPANPIEKFREVVGDRGSDSEILRNHKALLFDQKSGLLAFPIKVFQDIKVPLEDDSETDVFFKSVQTFQGAYIYNLNLENGFEQKGTVTHFTDEQVEAFMDNFWPYYHDDNVQRIIFMDDVLYTISYGKIKASDRETIEEINEVEID